MLTVAAPTQQVGGSTGAEPVLLTAPGALSLTGEPVTVDVDGEAFVGLARADEAQAWVDGLAHTLVTGVVDETTLAVEEVAGDAPDEVEPVADPALADIWLQEQTDDAVSITVDEPVADDVLVVVAADTAEVTLTWDRSARHPGAWPLLVVGILDVVLGLAWLVVLNARRARRKGTP
jgi:hypothetical protein